MVDNALIIHGGIGAGGILKDTQAFLVDTQQWEYPALAPAQSGRQGHTAVYDAALRAMVRTLRNMSGSTHECFTRADRLRGHRRVGRHHSRPAAL